MKTIPNVSDIDSNTYLFYRSISIRLKKQPGWNKAPSTRGIAGWRRCRSRWSTPTPPKTPVSCPSGSGGVCSPTNRSWRPLVFTLTPPVCVSAVCRGAGLSASVCRTSIHRPVSIEMSINIIIKYNVRYLKWRLPAPGWFPVLGHTSNYTNIPIPTYLLLSSLLVLA